MEEFAADSDAAKSLGAKFCNCCTGGNSLSSCELPLDLPNILSFLSSSKSIAEAAELVETTKERWAEAEIHRMRGTLLLSIHEDAAAEDSYCRALAVARQQRAKSWELRVAMSLARLWRDEGKLQQARELLAPVYGWFTEGFDTRDLKEAKALLDALA